MIELSKKYRTRDGREVRVYAVDAGCPFPVHGAVRIAAGIWEQRAWPQDGSFGDHTADLIEVKPSAIEEMIAWLEEQASPNLFWGDNQRDAFDLALIKARRIRDSNATSDE